MSWAWHKLPELPFMRSADVIMAKAVADIHRLHVGKKKRFVALSSIMPIHPIDRGPAEEKALQRRDVALANEASFLRQRHRLSEEFLNTFPAWSSITGICLVQSAEQPGRFYSFEGNGRLYALFLAFPKERDNWSVEVTEYLFGSQGDLRAVESALKLTRDRKGMNNKDDHDDLHS